MRIFMITKIVITLLLLSSKSALAPELFTV